MPSIKLILDRPKKDATCALVFHIIHDRKHRIVKYGINIKPEQWNGSTIINHPKQAQLNNILLKQKSRVDDLLLERHTWITIANSLTTKYDLVQHAALHAVPGQTDTYIKYQQSDVDDLNDRVCNNIKLKIERNAKSA